MVGFYNLLIPTNSKMKCPMNQPNSLYLFSFEEKASNLLKKSARFFKKVDHQTDLTIPNIGPQHPISCPSVIFGDLLNNKTTISQINSQLRHETECYLPKKIINSFFCFNSIPLRIIASLRTSIHP